MPQSLRRLLIGPVTGGVAILRVEVDAKETTGFKFRRYQRRAGAAERINHEIARARKAPD